MKFVERDALADPMPPISPGDALGADHARVRQPKTLGRSDRTNRNRCERSGLAPLKANAGGEPLRICDRGKNASDNRLVLANGSTNGTSGYALTPGPSSPAKAFDRYKLANDCADMRPLAHHLAHRNLQSTARYTALAPDRFEKFWQD
jgi:hypothetical protein